MALEIHEDIDQKLNQVAKKTELEECMASVYTQFPQ